MSRRERKKLATRTALIATSKRMFLENGFEKTTLEQICDEVDIHVTTFFKYFTSKEELVFARMLDVLQMLREGLDAKPADIPVTEFWWDFIERLDAHDREEATASIANFDHLPALRGRYAMIVQEYQEVIAAALAREARKDPETDIYSHLQAASLMSIQLTAGRRQLRLHGGNVAARTKVSRRIMASFPSRKDLAPQLRTLAAPARPKS